MPSILSYVGELDIILLGELIDITMMVEWLVTQIVLGYHRVRTVACAFFESFTIPYFKGSLVFLTRI